MLVWHPHSGRTNLVASGFYYSDGIAVSEDGSYLLVVETDALRVVKLWLTGGKVYTLLCQGAWAILWHNTPSSDACAPNLDITTFGSTKPSPEAVSAGHDTPCTP